MAADYLDGKLYNPMSCRPFANFLQQHNGTTGRFNVDTNSGTSWRFRHTQVVGVWQTGMSGWHTIGETLQYLQLDMSQPSQT